MAGSDPRYWRGADGKPDIRGSSYDRRKRKLWLLQEFGDGTFVTCSHCPRKLRLHEIFVDRIIPGSEGGRYTRDNIRPSCATCSHRQGAEMVNGAEDEVVFETPF